MKSIRWVFGAACSLMVVGGAQAAQAQGLELGARAGYGLPMGKVEDQGTNNSMSDGITGMIPLQLDVGYRATPNVLLGGYVMYGFGFAGDTVQAPCDSAKASGIDASCGVHDVRLGLQLHYHFQPESTDVDPWIGAGFGYEWLTYGANLSGNGLNADVSSTGKGFELLNLQGGADFSVAPGFGVGPFLSFSLAQYDSYSISCSGSACDTTDTGSHDINQTALHEWLLLGIRGAFVL